MGHTSDLLTTGETAKRLGVDPETVRKWIHHGRLSAITLPSGQFRVRRATVDAIRGEDPAGQLDNPGQRGMSVRSGHA